jgi:16S rRNA (guanine527-N7)-methyltransferase
MSADKLLNVSRETADRLNRFALLLNRWNPRINLVSASTLPDLWTRHIADSAQLYRLKPKGTRHWVDLGSGGGFPGLIVAILAHDADPDMRVTLIESDQRKAAFLRTAIRETGAPATVLAQRAESALSQSADVVSARAFAPLPELLRHVSRHLNPGGTALLPKGANWRDERDAAAAAWTFSLTAHPSTTNPDAVILQIGELAHV